MKKTTKILLVLAAVVAMTIGAVSTVMAADEVVIDPATWDCTDGWTAKDTNGTAISEGWAVDPAGHWYYFDNGYALENAYIIWKGEIYYFGGDAIMCEGWVEFKANEDVDVNIIASIDTDGVTDGNLLLDGNRDNAYGKSVWMFFKKGGAAASNEWVETEGLWYYFEEEIMVTSTYAYDVDGTLYGFGGDGNMLVDWVNATERVNANTPYEGSAKCWLYYHKDGALVDAGWEKINGEWYWFAQNYVGSAFDMASNYKIDAEATILVTDTFANIDNNVNGNYYYFDSTGAMQAGKKEVKIAKNAKVCTSEAEFLAEGVTNNAAGRDTGADRWFYVDAAGVIQKTNKGVSGYFYIPEGATNVYTLKTKDCDKDLNTFTATSRDVRKAGMTGEKVFDAFWVESNGKVHYYDSTGKEVKNAIVTFGGVSIAFDSKGYALTAENANVAVVEDGETAKYCAGKYYYFSDEFGTITVGGVTIPGCSTRKLSVVSGSAVTN